MKNIILFTILISTITVFAQEKDLSFYENKKIDIQNQIRILNDSLNKIKLEIDNMKSDLILNKIDEKPILGIAKIEAKLRDKPEILGEVILEIKEETPVQIIDLINGYLEVCINNQCGYISEVWIKKNDQINNFIKLKNKKEEYEKRKIAEAKKNKEKKIEEQKELEYKKQQIVNAKLQSELDDKMLKKYGKKTFDKMKEGYFWIGMNKEMLKFSLGNPDDINKTVNKYSKTEQWIYNNNLYIYLENNIVTSYQQ